MMPYPAAELSERLAARSERVASGCLLWLGHIQPTGYGTVSVGGKSRRVHRVAYEVANGVTLTPDMDVDHLCKVRNCIEPTHLEAVTHAENLRRSDSPPGVNSRKDKCHRGHDYLDVSREGKVRNCRACQVERVSCPECGRDVSRKSLLRHIYRAHERGSL